MFGMLEIELAYDSYTTSGKESKSACSEDTLSIMLISALLEIAMEWGGRPSTGEWIEKTSFYNWCGHSA